MDLPIGGDTSFFLDLLARYRRDPASVPADWRLHFEDGEAERRSGGADVATALLEAYRRFGHVEAALDPLCLAAPRQAPALDALRARMDADGGATEIRLGGETRLLSIADLDRSLRAVYAGAAAIEAEHLSQDAERDWLYAAFEAAMLPAPEDGTEERALSSVLLADEFERFSRMKFPTKKRFGIEGAESAIVFLRELLRDAAADFDEVVIGGMHRGRLATLATVLGKPAAALFAEIKGRDVTGGAADFTGDVPYHLGYAGELAFGDATLRVRVLPHPSHLIAVAPVALGAARAASASARALSLALHTDAAFAGQGLVGEVMQLGGLSGYSAGGTVHLVVNNQIGFTTECSEGRASLYCTDIGKAAGYPILHVNGEDPVAVARLAQLAMAWRRRFGKDILVDLVCYRRYGHNELDEPRFTQPRAWAAIDARPSLREAVADRVSHEAAARAAGFRAELEAGYQAAGTYLDNSAPLQNGAWGAIRLADEARLLDPVETGVPLDTLRRIGAAACALPDGIVAHAKVAQFYTARAKAVQDGEGINFATAEALAFGTLLAEGVSIRLSGQDAVRGTFTQRHLAVHDVASGARVVPLAALAADGATFEAVNSPLSEYAVLGFEYGHSLADPNALTVWEAQFGDFLNGAQVIVDQFVVSAEAKWRLMSGLVVLLPHGLEGQGPDHSSARIERLLQLTAGGNVVVANPSTPANLFHLLRRQIRAPWRKPLVVIAPKSLLRARACASSLAEMGPGTAFRPVIADPLPEPARRLVLCSGKVFYDLAQAREAAGLADVALLRIEQLYPLAIDEIRAEIARHPGADLVWCQEEAENQGAFDHVRRHLAKAGLAAPLGFAGRAAMCAPAGGSIERHDAEQAALVARALGL